MFWMMVAVVVHKCILCGVKGGRASISFPPARYFRMQVWWVVRRFIIVGLSSFSISIMPTIGWPTGWLVAPPRGELQASDRL